MKYLSRNCFILTVLLLAACADQEEAASSPGASPVKEAAIAIPDRHAARVTEEILLAGGNAVDAALAMNAVLCIYLDAGNIGGGGFMLIHMEGKPYFLDYRETAPGAAHRDMFLNDQGDVIENSTLIGARAAGVPGTVAGFWAAHQRFGKLPWEQVLQPAIKLAREGFVPARVLADDVQSRFDWFGTDTNFNQYFGEVKAGELFKQTELAATLTRIAEQGEEDFYKGDTARLLVAQMNQDGGLISLEDLANYEAIWREPLKANWRDFEVVSAPPPSSGGFGVIQLLKMKDYLNLFYRPRT